MTTLYAPTARIRDLPYPTRLGIRDTAEARFGGLWLCLDGGEDGPYIEGHVWMSPTAMITWRIMELGDLDRLEERRRTWPHLKGDVER